MHTWKRMSIEEKTFRAVGYTLITGFAILCLIPFLIIIASSFSSESYIIQHGYGLIPGILHWKAMLLFLKIRLLYFGLMA